MVLWQAGALIGNVESAYINQRIFHLAVPVGDMRAISLPESLFRKLLQ
jgi:hypothetical protein